MGYMAIQRRDSSPYRLRMTIQGVILNVAKRSEESQMGLTEYLPITEIHDSFIIFKFSYL